ncbi:unnamed protein product [Owenia fusiformis]|uniref:Luciferin 4-monooxygenase n=1 Tax=Owenia fusiformis TaxID=6347 RepID=A0A8S4PC83_OWEFU|nr:unnamed protein product [Owenia fusiformis]
MLEKIIKSPLSDVFIPEKRFEDYILDQLDEYGEATALANSKSGEGYRYSDIRTFTRSIASGLVRHGFKQGDVLCIACRNNIEYPLITYGVLRCGGVVTFVNPIYTKGELQHQLKDSGTTIVITTNDFINKIQEAAIGVASVKHVFVIDQNVPSGCLPYSSLSNDSGDMCPRSLLSNPKQDTAFLFYSSGTTGVAKGCMLTHHNMIATTEQRGHPGLAPKTGSFKHCVIAAIPFFHIYGFTYFLSHGLTRGWKILTMYRFSPELYLETVQKYRVTMLNMVPTIAVALSNVPDLSKYDLSSVKGMGSGAGPLNLNAGKSLTRKMKSPPFKQGYGLTEVPLCHISPARNWKSNSIGILVPSSECKIVNPETGKSLGMGEEGEICMRGPQVMKGYLNNQAATDATIDKEKWFHTGDIGYYDNDGHFYIVDRLKELIKYKGYQVAPAELERVLQGYPGVSEAAVIGIPDTLAGELPRAYVVLMKQAKGNVTGEDLIQHTKDQVAPYKQLRGGIQFVEELPKNATGKILRRVLKKQFLKNQHSKL